MMTQPIKPLLRGHFHQAAFFVSLGACGMLIASAMNNQALLASIIYSLSLIMLFGVSALYHRPQWNPQQRTWMRRLDHAAIFILIAGTGTPICLLAIPAESGFKLLAAFWLAAAFGFLQSLFWIKAPKWLSAILYIAMGWIALPYIPEIRASLGSLNAIYLISGGALYTIGAIIYASKRPNPSPKYFGYHEIFHLLVIFGAFFHFLVVRALMNLPLPS